MKNLRLILMVVLGFVLALIGVGVGFYIASDFSFAEMGEKLKEVHVLKLLAAFLLSLLFLSIAFLLQILIHEAGHLIFGLFSGYRFVSFRVFKYVLIRESEKLRIKRFDIQGTGGQCLLLPPDKPVNEIPWVLYNLGGLLANLFVVLMAVALLMIGNMEWVSALFLKFLIFFGLFALILNGIPMKVGGITNDAANTLLIHKDRHSKEALMMQLRCNALIQGGFRLKEIPSEWFDFNSDIDYSDTLQITTALLRATRKMDCGNWVEACEEFEQIWSHRNEIIQLFVKEIACELIYLSLVVGNEQRARVLCSDVLLKYAEEYKKYSSSKVRFLFAWALYAEANVDKACLMYKELVQNKDAYLMQGEVRSDIALIESNLQEYKKQEVVNSVFVSC